MKTITTSQGNTYDVDFAYGPTHDGGCMIQLHFDDRPLSQIAAEFEGLKEITKTEEGMRPETYLDYTALWDISRRDGGRVQIKLRKQNQS